MKKILTILLDLILLSGVILLPITAGGELHSILGFIFTIFLTIHIILKRKWLVGIGRKIRVVNSKQKQKYIIAILMLKVWYVSIMAAIFSAFTYETWPLQVHTNFVMLGVILTVIHLYQNFGKIKSLL